MELRQLEALAMSRGALTTGGEKFMVTFSKHSFAGGETGGLELFTSAKVFMWNTESK